LYRSTAIASSSRPILRPSVSGPGPGSASVRVRVTRDLGLFDITMAALGAMVGAAIFLLVGAAYSVAGPLVLLSLAVAALVAALAGMAYAELASGRPDASGGAYVWVRSALPAPSGFVSGWLSWGGHMAASALSALGLGIFLVELVRPSDESSFFGPNPLEVSLVALAVLALSAIAHFARVHLPIRALGRLTLGKILLIVLVAVLGVISVFQPGPPRGFAVGAPVSSLDLMLGAGVLFIAFQGFEVVAQLSDQVKHPESSVPRGVFLALLLAFLVYGGFFLAVLGNVPSDTLSGWPACGGCLGGSEDMVLSGIRHFVGGPYVRAVVLIIGIVSMYGALNSNLTAAIKTSFSMARDRLLPGSFARIGGREVPPAAVALTFVGAGFLVFLTIETIAILASLAFLGLFAFVHASVVALRRGERRSARDFGCRSCPRSPWPPSHSTSPSVLSCGITRRGVTRPCPRGCSPRCSAACGSRSGSRTTGSGAAAPPVVRLRLPQPRRCAIFSRRRKTMWSSSGTASSFRSGSSRTRRSWNSAPGSPARRTRS